jgi:hypothetical protein
MSRSIIGGVAPDSPGYGGDIVRLAKQDVE